MQLPTPNIPVVIDDIKRLEKFQFTRCTYYSIEHRSSFKPWTVQHQDGTELPVILLEQSGIIIQPSENRAYFDSVDAFDSLYERIENESGQFIDVNEIWFPNRLFHDEGFSRGSVYRVGVELFKMSHDFQQELLTLDEFMSLSSDMGQQLEFAPSETAALAEWNQQQIKVISEAYHSDSTPRLQRKPDLAED